jgi:hypothetical protein
MLLMMPQWNDWLARCAMTMLSNSFGVHIDIIAEYLGIPKLPKKEDDSTE